MTTRRRRDGAIYLAYLNTCDFWADSPGGYYSLKAIEYMMEAQGRSMAEIINGPPYGAPRGRIDVENDLDGANLRTGDTAIDCSAALEE